MHNSQKQSDPHEGSHPELKMQSSLEQTSLDSRGALPPTDLDEYDEEPIAMAIDPFKVDLDHFLRMNEDELDELFDWAAELNDGFVKEFFNENTDRDWVVIGRAHGNVLASGSTSSEPDEGSLMSMAQELDRPVFTYSRPVAYRSRR